MSEDKQKNPIIISDRTNTSSDFDDSSDSTKVLNTSGMPLNSEHVSNMTVTQSAPTNPKAIWSLVLGILSITSCCFLTGIPGWILGAKARKEIRATGQNGDGIAMAGFITSIIGTVTWTLIIVIYLGISITALLMGNNEILESM